MVLVVGLGFCAGEQFAVGTAHCVENQAVLCANLRDRAMQHRGAVGALAHLLGNLWSEPGVGFPYSVDYLC